MKPKVRVYTDYKSPYAYVANKPLFDLEKSHDVELEWLPYTLRIAEYLGSVDDRSPHYWRKVRYAYMDARRYANEQGLILKGPKRIYDATYASAGMLFAQRNGFFRAYHDTVFEMFWTHQLDLDVLDQMKAVIGKLGGSAAAFETFATGPAQKEVDAITTEAESLGVFGVPSMLLDGELFWGGDRVDMLTRRLEQRAKGISPSDQGGGTLNDPMASLTIYSVAACPYAQRTRILLHLKGLQAELVELDLSKPRPAWFLDINPAGKVPALVHDGRPLNESSVINEYLEDVFPQRPVFPADPYLKAQSRILIDFCNTQFTTNLYRVLMEQDAGRRGRVEVAARKNWEWLETFLLRVSPDTDFVFAGFGMADLTYAPFFQRYELNEYFWGFKIPDGLSRVERWRRALAGHPSVQATSLPMGDYAKLYADYALGFSNGAIPPGHERSSLDPTVPLSQRPMPPRRVA